jgi:hypothetical protein
VSYLFSKVRVLVGDDALGVGLVVEKTLVEDKDMAADSEELRSGPADFVCHEGRDGAIGVGGLRGEAEAADCAEALFDGGASVPGAGAELFRSRVMLAAGVEDGSGSAGVRDGA